MNYKLWGAIFAIFLPTQIFAMGYSSEYVSCMNSAGSNNTTACMQDELKQQDKRVKSYFNVLLMQYDNSDERKAQKDLQKQWFDTRDQRCAEKNKSESLGHKSRYYNCALKMTVQQANSLEQKTYRYR
ncbi:lysozyme inhibitor LprI family protein [Acinetobacter silvestris]|uniref:Lysozyme inhibitor LprI-like N-terminal domain-containing protein n=1 Tax=Acinetobacter silvestris TaxID=1977882 RepID=A0A1Y3CDD7_9GAMM|nr:lysozyme inhibitor LprI family protein [Acinetobacter silvestris]OTG65067.1 hypothetical protein B9T28_09745 [Acinetobacter silvestris]